MAAVGDPRGYYKLLGIRRTASAEEVKAAFRERAKLYHPDGVGQGGDDDERFRRLREAYDTLRDPQRRLNYDTEALTAERSVPPRGARVGAAAESRGGSGGTTDDASSSGIGEARRAVRSARGVAAARGGPGGAGLLPLLLVSLALVMALGLLGLIWSRIDQRDSTIAELSRRLEANEARMTAQPASPPAELYAGEIAFPPEAADLDPSRTARLDAMIRDLAAKVEDSGTGRGWVVLVEGRAGRGMDQSGLLLDAWQAALLRVGSVTDYLVRHGIADDRVAVRFQAGVRAVDGGSGAAPPEAVTVKLLCCVR